jgi:hypothetical protein
MTETVQDEAPVEPDIPVEEPEPAAEPEPDEAAEEEQDEPTPAENLAALEMSERDLEEMSKKLERSATTWRNRVSELMGEMAQGLVPCELCDPRIPGFHFPAEMEQPRDDLHAHLLEVLKNPAAPEYAPAQHVRQCVNCGGWGKVKSGSRVAGKELVVCPTCKGQGFQGDATVNPPAPFMAQPQNGTPEVEFPEEAQPLATGDTDVWGSPRLLDDGQENPNYGKMPQYKVPGLP